jgi:UDP-N-acetylmuramyl pentapeptide phosphotransferase/UDP-N-acetylglucosamine-1-phosphate transferase
VFSMRTTSVILNEDTFNLFLIYTVLILITIAIKFWIKFTCNFCFNYDVSSMHKVRIPTFGGLWQISRMINGDQNTHKYSCRDSD